MLKKSLVIASLGCLAGVANAAFLYNGGSYTQNFNALDGVDTTWTNDTLLTGWYAFKTGSTGTGGTRDNTTSAVTAYVLGSGSTNSGALFSFGSTSATDRALGSTASGTPGDFVYALVLQNNTGSAFTSFTLGYNGEQWRDGGATTPVAQSLIFDYTVVTGTFATSVLSASNTTGYTSPGAGWDFTSPVFTNTGAGAAVDGNVAGRVNGLGGSRSLTWNPGEYLVLRWWDDNNTGNDHGLAIDDLSFSATAVPEPTTMGALALGLLALRRRKKG